MEYKARFETTFLNGALNVHGLLFDKKLRRAHRKLEIGKTTLCLLQNISLFSRMCETSNN